MIKNLIHVTFISYVWKRYKFIIISTALLFISFWLIGKLHQDFLSYSDLNNDKQYVGWSFLIKWFAYLAGIAVYFWFNDRHSRLEKNSDAVSSNARDKHKKNSRTSALADNQDAEPNTKDHFAEIRQKPRLRSTADFVIEKHKNKDC